MNNLDLDKLTEECGELIHAAAKLKIFLQNQAQVWSVTEEDLLQNLQDEIADVSAAASVVISKRCLSEFEVGARATRKVELFLGWGFDK